jgi:hypothetical protein
MVAGHGIAPCPSGYEPDVLLLHSPAEYMAGVDGNAPSSLVLETGRHSYGTPISGGNGRTRTFRGVILPVFETGALPIRRRFLAEGIRFELI